MAPALQSAEQRERVLQILEAVSLRLGLRSFCFTSAIDLLLELILPNGQRIQLRLRDDERLVAVVRGDEAADQRDAQLLHRSRSAESAISGCVLNQRWKV